MNWPSALVKTYFCPALNCTSAGLVSTSPLIKKNFFLRAPSRSSRLNNNVAIFKIIPLQRKYTVNDLFADIRGTVKYFDDLLKPEIEEWGELC
jgi:hypothetical protein